MRPQGVAIAIMNMGIWIKRLGEVIQDIRISIGPAGPTPFRARAAEATLRGKTIQKKNLPEAVEAVHIEAKFRTSPHRSTAEYRRHLVTPLLEETLLAAWDNSMEKSIEPVVDLNLRAIFSGYISGVEMEIIVNGNRLELEARPGEMLSDLLRERLGLTGTKIGCNEAECGACTVLVNGEPVLSCNFPSAKAAGKQIITIEGLAGLFSSETPSPGTSRKLHPLQEAFIQHGAVQCGFCIPGQIITAYALLQREPDPGEEEIRGALKNTLCRCAGYPTIVSSIKAAAKSIREGNEVVDPQTTPSSDPGKVVGRPQVRPDAEAKVTGAAVYSDDIKFPGMLHARVKRAGVPHAF